MPREPLRWNLSPFSRYTIKTMNIHNLLRALNPAGRDKLILTGPSPFGEGYPARS
jgi:hypothetical protein